MKPIFKTPILFVIISLMSFIFLSKVIAQNIFDIEIDPKHATTVFISSTSKIKVETWNEDYILFQVSFEHQPDENKIFQYLETNKQNIVNQEFTVNDFLNLELVNLDELLRPDDCKSHQIFTYKIIAPKNLDLELRCKNDLTVYGKHPEMQSEDFDFLKALKK